MEKLKNAAKMMATGFSNFPDKVQEKLKLAYQEERYQDVINLAAAHDVGRRNDLDSKIKSVLNTDFELRDIETKEVIPDCESVLSSWDSEMIGFASRDGEDHWGNYEWDKGQQMYVYQVEDVPGRTFKTATEATDAYCLKKGIDRHDKSKKHRFTRHLVQVEDQKEQDEKEIDDENCQEKACPGDGSSQSLESDSSSS